MIPCEIFKKEFSWFLGDSKIKKPNENKKDKHPK